MSASSATRARGEDAAAGRRWLRVGVRCPSAGDRSELLVEPLLLLGARGVEELEGWYVAYFEQPDDLESFLTRTRAALERESGLGPLLIEHAWQDHEEWAESWKRGLAPRRVTERIVVHPSWLPPTEAREGDVVIELDPGMAFGTAEHGTTRGCLRLLDGTVRPGDEILDLGAGSGILAIAVARLGAVRVVAVEGDAYACEALRENVERNAVDDRVTLIESWARPGEIAGLGPVDGVVANMESGLLTPFLDDFRMALRPGGWLIVSGILADELDPVRAALERTGFQCEAVDEDGEWRSARFVRVSSPS